MIRHHVIGNALLLEPVDQIKVCSEMTGASYLPLPVFRPHVGNRPTPARVTAAATVRMMVVERNGVLGVGLKMMIEPVFDHRPLGISGSVEGKCFQSLTGVGEIRESRCQNQDFHVRRPVGWGPDKERNVV